MVFIKDELDVILIIFIQKQIRLQLMSVCKIANLFLAIILLQVITPSTSQNVKFYPISFNDYLIGEAANDGLVSSTTLSSDHSKEVPENKHKQEIEKEQKEEEEEQEEEEKNQEHNQHHINIPGVGLSIVFIFGSLLYGSLLKLFSRVTSIPYNPLLLLSGIILGVYHMHLGIIGQATHLISQVNPSGILAIFLPCLIFESAFKTQWHTFKKMAGQSLIMGVLSSLVGASVIMIILKLLIDHENIYSWHQALMLGSMLTCTDILSFVHKLKRGGTPQRLTSLIEGESLFNYCTCVMIFQFVQYYKEMNEDFENWDYLSLFFEYVLGGIIFGVVAGAIAVYCIKRMIYDGPLAVTLMVIFTYSIYLIAEYSSFRISGIISLSVFSLYMNAFGKTWLFGETEEYSTSFWNYLVFVAETSIFMIAGVLVGANIIRFQYGEINLGNEFTITIYIYLTALFSRFFSIGVFIKYLRKMGEGMTWSEVVVLTFAGLKGAIGIALAMHVYNNQNYGKIVGGLILFHVTTNSLITLIVHGLGTNFIVRALGISSLKRVEYKFFQEYLYSFEVSILEQKEKLRNELKNGYEMIEWQQIERLIGLPDFRSLGESTKNILKNKEYKEDNKFEKSQQYKMQKLLKDYNHRAEGEGSENDKFDHEVEYRKRFLKNLIAKYWQFHDNNFTTPAALMLLIQSANSDLDKETEEIESWNWIKGEISFMMRIYSELMKLTLINEVAKSYLFEYVSFCYDVVSSYIKANEQVREDLQDFYNTADYKDRQEEINILRNIMRESEENQKEAEFFLVNYLQPSFPEIEKEVKTRKVSFFILHTFKDIIDKNNQNGQLEPNEYDMLNHIIDSKSLELNLSSPTWEEPNLFLILKENELFRMIPDPVLHLITEQIGEEFPFDANERIVDNSQIAKYFFFVKKGGCIVEFTNESLVYKQPMLAGQVFGFQCLLTNIYHSKTTSNTMAEIVQVKKGLMLKVFETFPQFEEQFWKKHIFECYKMFVKKDDITFRIGHFQKDEVEEMVDHFKLERLEPIEIEETSKDLIFIRGHVEIITKQEGSAVKSDRPSLATNNSEFASPFTFISRLEEVVVKIKEPSYFLVGELDYELFDRLSVRMSRTGGKSINKYNKKSI